LRSVSTILIITAAILIAVSGCKKSSDLPSEDMGYSYFPYEPGDYLIYDVDSTYYDDFYDTVFNLKFKIKEYYESYFYDSQGRLSIRIERWYKWNDTTDWFLRDVWYSTLTPSLADRTEENVRLTKLVFPVRNHTEWDGNAFNIYDREYYEYEDPDESMSIGTFTFDSTVIVAHAPTPNLVESVNKTEIYARNVGLVYKYFLDISKDIFTGDTLNGTQYTWTLIEYGEE